MAVDSPPTAVSVLIVVVVFTVMSVIIAKFKSSCRKWEHQDNIRTVPAGTVRQTIVATIPTRTTTNYQRSASPDSYNRTETPFSADNNLVYGHQDERSVAPDPFQGYDFSSRVGNINHSVRSYVISRDVAPRYVSPRAPEITPEPVHFSGYKPNDKDGLPTYEEVVEMNHQSR